MKKIALKIKQIFSELKQERNKNIYIPVYRIVEIIKNADNEYTVHVQLIGKNLTFHMKPEEVLANDSLVDQFSPQDIRTLTYLGYLGINAPKYKILARRLIDNNQVAFAIQKKGEKGITVKTAKEILSEQGILANMHPNDAKTVGYILASENLQHEADDIKKLSDK